MERKNNFLIFPYTTQSNPVQGGDKNYPKDTHYCFEIRFLNFCMVLVLFIYYLDDASEKGSMIVKDLQQMLEHIILFGNITVILSSFLHVHKANLTRIPQ